MWLYEGKVVGAISCNMNHSTHSQVNFWRYVTDDDPFRVYYILSKSVQQETVPTLICKCFPFFLLRVCVNSKNRFCTLYNISNSKYFNSTGFDSFFNVSISWIRLLLHWAKLYIFLSSSRELLNKLPLLYLLLLNQPQPCLYSWGSIIWSNRRRKGKGRWKSQFFSGFFSSHLQLLLLLLHWLLLDTTLLLSFL
jgi:hypothetical protein